MTNRTGPTYLAPHPLTRGVAMTLIREIADMQKQMKQASTAVVDDAVLGSFVDHVDGGMCHAAAMSNLGIVDGMADVTLWDCLNDADEHDLQVRIVVPASSWLYAAPLATIQAYQKTPADNAA